MSFYKKFLVAPGTYNSGDPSKPIVVTPDRIDRWCEKFNKLRSEGYRFPTPWGHKIDAEPTTDDPFARDEQSARWNAGYIEKLVKEKDGSLSYIGTVPPGYRLNAATGALENPKDHTVIAEVSPGIGHWIDGKGRRHEDLILHAALCTFPVQNAQPGFEEADEPLGLPAGMQLLSSVGKIEYTAILNRGPAMADEINEKKKKPVVAESKDEAKQEPKEKDKMPDMDDDSDVAPSPLADPELPPMPDGSPAPDPADEMAEKEESKEQPVAKDIEYVKKITDAFNQLGVPLMDDTDRNNILERVAIALSHAVNSGASLHKMDDDDEEDDLMSPSVPGSPEASGVAGMAPGFQFMSTKTGKIMQLSGTLLQMSQKAAENERRLIESEIDKIAAMGPAAMKAIAHEFKNNLSKQFMSISPDGDVQMVKARKQLADMKKLLKASGFYAFHREFLSAGVPEASPVQNPDTTQTAKEAADELVARGQGTWRAK